MSEAVVYIVSVIFFVLYFLIAYRVSKREGINILRVAFLLGVKPDSPLTRSEKLLVLIAGVLLVGITVTNIDASNTP